MFGMAPGATNISLFTLKRRLHELPRDRNIVLYCHSGAAAGKAKQILDALGFKAFNGGGYKDVLKIVGHAQQRPGSRAADGRSPETGEIGEARGADMIRMVVQVAVVLVVAGPGPELRGSRPSRWPPRPAWPGICHRRQIFTLLFLMLGPFKIIGPFAQLTKGADDQQARHIAWLAIAFASAALLVAALLGRRHPRQLPHPGARDGTGRRTNPFPRRAEKPPQQFEMHADDAPGPTRGHPALRSALMPLAFPTIVTPYGIAAVVVLMTVAPDLQARLGPWAASSSRSCWPTWGSCCWPARSCR